MAAVDKIEEKRKPDDFIGHRNRNLAWESASLEKDVITELLQKENGLPRPFGARNDTGFDMTV